LLLVAAGHSACGADTKTPTIAPNACDAATCPADAAPHDAAVATPTVDRAPFMSLSPAGDALPAPPPDVSNRFADSAAASEFGRKLFDEPGFAGPLLDGDNDGSGSALGNKAETGKVACAGCHVASSGYSDNRSYQKQISLGAGWGRRRAPSLLDVGQARLLMWDGSKDALYNQIFGPIESVVEMNSSRLFVAEQVFALYKADYESIFGALPPLDDAKRFPALSAKNTGCRPMKVDPDPVCDGPFHGIPGDHAEFDSLTIEDQDRVTEVVVNIGKALGAFERTLGCGVGRFDAWVHGDDAAMSPEEQRGAALFVGRAQCVSCHSGPFMSDQKFHNAGLQPELVQASFIDLGDRGAASGLQVALDSPLNTRGRWSDSDDDRLPQSIEPSMEGAFRTPTLRCVSQRPAFMHTGQLTRLEDVVAFFNRGGDVRGFSGVSELRPLGLSSAEQADIVAFLRALDGVSDTR
jgi:cytochrome c peroxidase